MKFQLETSEHFLISGYGPGRISVNNTDYRCNLMISRTQVFEDWFDGDLKHLSLADFAPLLDLQGEQRPEIIVLGTGDQHRFPRMQLMAEMRATGVALEVMNTRAACRTFSVLVGEYRHVAAALLQLTP